MTPTDEQRAAINALLDERQKRAENLHDLLFAAREIARLETRSSDRRLYDALNAALYNLRGDPFDMHIRAALTAPSTAAGEMAFVCGCGWDGSYADMNETVEGMTCPKCRLGRNLDCAAALATPPAQSPPWQEQAARQCEEWAIVLTAKGSNAAKVFDRIRFNADAVKLRDHARAFRALLFKPAKGEG